MNKEDFKMREVTFTSKEFPNMRVTRTRTSKGYCGISVKMDTGKVFSLTNEGTNKNYEQKARALVELIDKALNDHCTINQGFEDEQSRD